MTQNDYILQHIRERGAITPLEAFEHYDCLRLAARVLDLKRAGHQIVTEIREAGGKRFAAYRLA